MLFCLNDYAKGSKALVPTNSKEILADTLRPLLREKLFGNITVSDIIAKSGPSRAIFYRHFQDKYSLMSWVYESRASEIERENSLPSQSINILVESARYMKENASYFSQVIKYHGQNLFK